MTGYKIKFNGIDRLYDAFSWRLTRRAKAVWNTGQVLQGNFLKELETEVAKTYNRKYAVGVGSATDGLYFAMKAIGLDKDSTIMCPVLSYIATSGAIKRLGAKIQFVDTDNMGLLGDFDRDVFGHPFEVLLFCVFMFIVVIIMLNVLIAIVREHFRSEG